MATTTTARPTATIQAIPTRTTMETRTIILAPAMDLPVSIPARAMDHRTTIRIRVMAAPAATIPAAAIIPPQISWEVRAEAMEDMEAMEVMAV